MDEKEEVFDLKLAARQVYHNISEWEFDISGHYKMEEKEAKKVLKIMSEIMKK